MTIPAYVYARFSSMEQGKGTSPKRQLESARDFIKRHSDWDYLTDPLAQQERDFTDQANPHTQASIVKLVGLVRARAQSDSRALQMALRLSLRTWTA